MFITSQYSEKTTLAEIIQAMPYHGGGKTRGDKEKREHEQRRKPAGLLIHERNREHARSVDLIDDKDDRKPVLVGMVGVTVYNQSANE